MNNQDMTNEERQALIDYCNTRIAECATYAKARKVMEIALAALTAEPVAFTAQSNIDGFGGGVGYMWPPGNEKPTDVALYANPIDNTAPQYEALAGWKMVPVEPTDEMLAAYYDKSIAPISRLSVIGYRAMLEAAPKQEA